MATVQQLEAALLKAHNAGDTRGAQAIAEEIKRVRSAPQDQPQAEDPGVWGSIQQGLDAGKLSVFHALERGGRAIGLIGSETPQEQRQHANFERDFGARQRAAQQYHPIAFGTGKIGAQTVLTAPIASGLGAATRVVAGGTKIGNALATALESGGFKTGLLPTRAAVKEGLAAAPTLAQRAVDMAIRGTAGATTGAVTAAATDDNATAGALVGALMPTLGSTTLRLGVDKVLAPAYERLTNQVGAQRAAAIFRQAFQMTIQEAKALAAKMPEGMTFGEGLVRAGKKEPVVQALQQEMATGPGTHIFEPLAKAQTTKEQAVLNAARGGETAGEAEANLLKRQQQASSEYAPAYEAARQRANVGAEVIPPLQAQGRAAAQTAEEQSALARRMAFGAERADTRVAQMDDLGDQFNPAAINTERGVAGAMTNRAETAAQEAIRLREEAAAVQTQLANLRAKGIDVLESGPIVSKIRQKAMAEGVTPAQREALLATADDIGALGPIARAGDLDAIYREGGLKAQKLIQSLNPTGMAKQTSNLLKDIQPDIADAIEAAGGKGYSAAKTEYATALQDIGKQRFAGELSDIYGKSEGQFADVMGGKTGAGIDVVKQAFPGGGKLNYDVNAMLGPKGGAAGPSRLPSLQLVAENIGVRNKMAEQASEGSDIASSLLKNPPVEKDLFALGNLAKTPIKLAAGASSPMGGLAMHIVDLIHSGRVDAATGKALSEGLKSGKSAEELLSLLPLADRIQIWRRAIPGTTNRFLSGAGVNTFNALNTPPPPPPQNAMAGQ